MWSIEPQHGGDTWSAQVAGPLARTLLLDSKSSIGQLSRRAGIAPTTLRYYEKIGLLPGPARVGGQRRYEESALSRLEIIAMCKIAGFTLDEIAVLFADDVPGRPLSRALALAKLGEIDARIAALVNAKQVIEWGMACTCASIDACICGVHRAKPDAAARGTSAGRPTAVP